jgi:plasmid stabilization system protein ParE
MTRVLVAPQARRDLFHIVSHLATVAGLATADKWDRRLWKAIDGLSVFPGSGAPRPVLGENTRIWTVHPYVIIYEHIRGFDELHILRVVHGKRDTSGLRLKP